MDSFLRACGASGPLTLEVEGPGLAAPERRSFAQPFVLVGRDDAADLLLDHEQVSRRHAYLQLIEGSLFFVDLESRTGTVLHGAAADSGHLPAGEALTVGPYTVRHVAPPPWPGAPTPPAPPNPLLARSADSDELPRVRLEFQSGTAGHSVWRMSQTLALVGRSSRCKVRLLDSNVSKLHCALIRTAEGLWAVDLLGRNGIMVNGRSVRFGRLDPGDILGLGHVIVRPTFGDAAGSVGLPARRPNRGWAPGSTAPGAAAGPANAPLTPAVPPAAFASDSLPAMPDLAGQEPALGLLLNHFGQMQQQMLEQFQQSMMMMMQMFGGMHREQMGLVREELDRLRELNDEIKTIKTQIATGPAQPQQPPPQRGANGYAPPPPTGARLGPFPPTAAAPRPGPKPAQAPPTPPPAAEPPPPKAAAPPPPPPGAGPNVQVHDWLNERLNALQTEQQNRWQRIMGLIRGGQ